MESPVPILSYEDYMTMRAKTLARYDTRTLLSQPWDLQTSPLGKYMVKIGYSQATD